MELRGSPGCLYVHSGENRYLFNCGEGTQKLASEHKTKVKNLEHVFFTYKNWENIGGLPGLSLTLQDIGVTEVFVHGPSQIPDLYHMSKTFLNASEIKIQHYEADMYSDGAMTVKTVPIKSSRLNHSNESTSDNERVKRRKSDNQDVSFAYICKLPIRLGSLSPEKCVEQGVPPGPLLGKLKNKEDITLSDGRVILSSSVTSPDQPGPVFIVVECPTADFLDDLESCTEWSKYQTNASSTEEDIAKCVVHFTPSSVMNNVVYQTWMSKFPQQTFHMFLNDTNSSSNSISGHKIRYKLNTLHSTIFPLPKTNLESKPLPILAKYYLRPTVELRADESPDIDTQKFLDELVIEDSDLLQKECEKLKEDIEAVTNINACKLVELGNITESAKKNNGETRENQFFPEIVFLGTGSSIPSEYRNASGILVNFSPSKSMILDIGEGSFCQLMHSFGSEEIDSVLKRINCVYISHPHADHHLGLIQFLNERKRAFADESYEPLHLIAPLRLLKWLEVYNERFEPINDLFTAIPNNFLLQKNQKSSEYLKHSEQLHMNLPIKEIFTTRVKHCPDAFGVIITDNKGWKIVYSGDTMPCERLIDAGRNCDLLIHEATLEDDLKEEAVFKSHSTTSEAIDIGQKMNARFTILTHFSQRYSKIPIFNENFNKSIGIAFDHMRVRPCDLPLLSLFNEPLKAMFAKDYKEMEDKTVKKKRNKEIDMLKASNKQST
ncbi:Zinc phosphodiesterase ELAC protein 2 [Nymphon striatum]|nr:Zinc phosphodiesterase ELAC protein 2 [Nymphon striatum]